MNEEFEEDVFGLMDDLRGDNRVAVPDVGGIRRRAKKQQNRTRLAVGATSIALVVAIGGGLWATNNNSAESTVASGDADAAAVAQEPDTSPAVGAESAPTELPPGVQTPGSQQLDQLSFGDWMNAHTLRQAPDESLAVKATTAQSQPDAEQIRLNLMAFPLDGTYEYFVIFSDGCGPMHTYGMIDFEDDTAFYQRDRLPDTTNIGFDDIGYECDPPEPANLSKILKQGFAVTSSRDGLTLSSGADKLTFYLTDLDFELLPSTSTDPTDMSPSLKVECTGSETSGIFDYGSPITEGASSAEEAFTDYMSDTNPNSAWSHREDWHDLRLATTRGNVSGARAVYVDNADNTYLVLSASPIDGYWVIDGFQSCSPSEETELVSERRMATPEETRRLTSDNPMDCEDVGGANWDYAGDAPPRFTLDEALESAILEINEDALNDAGIEDYLPTTGWVQFITEKGHHYFVHSNDSWQFLFRVSEVGPQSATICAPDLDDNDGRQAVPILGEVYVATTTATSFSVGVGSCNGNPSFELTETDTEIRLAVISWLPAGSENDGCADLIDVVLEQPIGDRTLVDGLAGQVVPVIVDG